MIDVAIIGGCFAGLTAELQLGRASRSVTVIDPGAPRNRMSPQDSLARIRADVASYPTVSMTTGSVVDVKREDDGFNLRLASGQSIKSRRVLLAHGVRDSLPDLPGAAEAWGRTLLHCPYCHGYQVKGSALAVLGVHQMSGHQAAMLLAGWSENVTLLTGLGVEVHSRGPEGATVDTRPVAALRPMVDGLAVDFHDGSASEFGGVFVAPRVSLADTPAMAIGCATSEWPLSPFIQVGPMGQTSVRGVFAAGDCATPAHSTTPALGAGAIAGTGCHQSLLFPDNFPPLEVSEI